MTIKQDFRETLKATCVRNVTTGATFLFVLSVSYFELPVHSTHTLLESFVILKPYVVLFKYRIARARVCVCLIEVDELKC